MMRGPPPKGPQRSSGGPVSASGHRFVAGVAGARKAGDGIVPSQARAPLARRPDRSRPDAAVGIGENSRCFCEYCESNWRCPGPDDLEGAGCSSHQADITRPEVTYPRRRDDGDWRGPQNRRGSTADEVRRPHLGRPHRCPASTGFRLGREYHDPVPDDREDLRRPWW